MLRVRFVVAIAAMTACGYEHAPRSGPLAALADSMFPPGVAIECKREKLPLLSSMASSRFCQSPPSPDWIYIGRSGRVLSVVVNWADDSAGVAEAGRLSGSISRATGLEPSRGEADASAEEYHWRTDTVCYSLYRSFDHRGYQAGWSLPEWLGQCV